MSPSRATLINADFVYDNSFRGDRAIEWKKLISGSVCACSDFVSAANSACRTKSSTAGGRNVGLSVLCNNVFHRNRVSEDIMRSAVAGRCS